MPRATGQGSRLSRYEAAWESINRLIRQGGSWSGYERNCFFTPLEPGRFANASAASGLDFKDDGRALVVWDFDRDGDQDMLLKNRSAPQLRLLENIHPREKHRIVLELEGRDANSRAIGARVTVKSDERSRVREVHAGSGFLSQDPGELFFGLGESLVANEIRIRWPSGRVQSFRDVAADRRYTIREGDAKLRAAPFRVTNDGSTLAGRIVSGEVAPAPPRDATRRLWLIEPVPLPPFSIVGVDGRALERDAGSTGPWVLNLWRPDCAICVAELAEWSRSRSADDPRIVAVTPAGPGELEPLRKLEERFAVRIGAVSRDDLLALAILIEDVARCPRDLAVPASLLIDSRGRIVRLYQGRVSFADLVMDARKAVTLESEAAADAERKRVELALPFPGRYFALRPHRNPFHLGISWLEAGFPELASSAFEATLAIQPDDVESLYNLGVLRLRAGELPRAREFFSAALEREPDFVDALVNLGVVAARSGAFREAESHLERSLELRPDHVEALLDLAGVRIESARAADALGLLRRAKALEPEMPAVHKQLGRVLRDLDDLPSAREAYESALALDPDDAESWNNLGVLLARLGEIDRAHEACERALTLAPAYASAHNNDGLVLSALGRLSEARARFARAIELAPDLKAPRLNLARSYIEAGDAQRARTTLSAVLERWPNEPTARRWLAELEREE